MLKVSIPGNGIFVERVVSGIMMSSSDESIKPEKIEYTGGIFTYEDERLTVLAMLLENLGIDKAVQLGNLQDWKSAIAQRESEEH